jgi:hypothetical protein
LCGAPYFFTRTHHNLLRAEHNSHQTMTLK